MEEDKKPDQQPEAPPAPEPPPEDFKKQAWKHDQELSFKRVIPHLHVLKDALQKTIQHEKAKLAQMIGARDSIRK